MKLDDFNYFYDLIIFLIVKLIITACINGTYGKDCVYNCTLNICPDGGFCNKINGTCPKGRIAGRFNFNHLFFSFLLFPFHMYWHFQIKAYDTFWYNINWKHSKKITLNSHIHSPKKHQNIKNGYIYIANQYMNKYNFNVKGCLFVI